ncbi:DUF1382 family protein [Pseudochrobactrum sp. Wa41.01b-1]|uniref:DUF1382 family protein n=1 Tax=Pseudochrobactrum sp. Wa41.01b-1 TaxID=2864102 RepID=UPI001C68DB36|nr:DUF1382 family protein [Pseudochrobactrum sp. Wa41.01b-1]QYM72871.1 DUF1382 family protein [Pseudochrobactrum sp. Wa41.01b-1]
MTNKVAQIRKALAVVEAFKKSHVVFVPVPVLNDEDHAILAEMAAQRLEKLQGEQQHDK